MITQEDINAPQFNEIEIEAEQVSVDKVTMMTEDSIEDSVNVKAFDEKGDRVTIKFYSLPMLTMFTDVLLDAVENWEKIVEETDKKQEFVFDIEVRGEDNTSLRSFNESNGFYRNK